jgi:hypothetical protein
MAKLVMLKRREFLTGLTAVAGSYILTACGGSSDSGTDLDATAAAQSRTGTLMPPASSIVDSTGKKWTLNGTTVYRAGRATSAQNAKVVLYYKSVVYYQDTSNAWYQYANGRWTQSTDPRAAATTNTASSSTAAAAAATTGMAAIGVHCEGDNQTSQYDSFSQWLGKPVQYRVVFTARDSWNDVANPYYLDATKVWISDPSRVEVMSVPLLLPGDGGFSTIANGQRDSAFQSLAQNIKALGKPSQIIIRLGWEHNGNWFPWSSLNDPTGYQAAFRRVVSVMRAVSPEIRFDWCTDYQSYSSFDWTRAYPGDDVVDIISMDVYDEYNQGWSDVLNAPNGVGLNALRAFAKNHGKPEAYPEWGCSIASSGHGDSPTFIDNVYSWISSGGSSVLYQSYWNTNLGGPNAAIQGPLAGNVPNAAAEYKAVFSR